jgi:hypothetical protein
MQHANKGYKLRDILNYDEWLKEQMSLLPTIAATDSEPPKAMGSFQTDEGRNYLNDGADSVWIPETTCTALFRIYAEEVSQRAYVSNGVDCHWIDDLFEEAQRGRMEGTNNNK